MRVAYHKMYVPVLIVFEEKTGKDYPRHKPEQFLERKREENN